MQIHKTLLTNLHSRIWICGGFRERVFYVIGRRFWCLAPTLTILACLGTNNTVRISYGQFSFVPNRKPETKLVKLAEFSFCVIRPACKSKHRVNLSPFHVKEDGPTSKKIK